MTSRPCRAKNPLTCPYHGADGNGTKIEEANKESFPSKRSKKKCPRCKKVKGLSDFGKNASKKDGLQVNCNECRKAVNSKYYRKTPHLNESRKQHLIRRIELVAAITHPLLQKGCVDCKGSFPPVAMDFDHVRGDKVANISALARSSLSDEDMIAALHEELPKCDICCANCHRKRTIGRLNNSARMSYLNGDYDRLNAKQMYVYSFLSKGECVDCKTKDFEVLELDHVRGVKTQKLSKMINQAKYSLSDVKEELEKCDIRCATCHRLVTNSRSRNNK